MLFTPAALRFFKDLKRHNNKPWLEAVRNIYSNRVDRPTFNRGPTSSRPAAGGSRADGQSNTMLNRAAGARALGAQRASGFGAMGGFRGGGIGGGFHGGGGGGFHGGGGHR